MADFVQWTAAAEPALPWASGTFLKAYDSSRQGANATAIESSPVGPAVEGLIHGRGWWEGIAKELLAELEDHHAGDKTLKRRDWPHSRT